MVIFIKLFVPCKTFVTNGIASSSIQERIDLAWYNLKSLKSSRLDCWGEPIFSLPMVLCVMLNPLLCTMKKAVLSCYILRESRCHAGHSC